MNSDCTILYLNFKLVWKYPKTHAVPLFAPSLLLACPEKEVMAAAVILLYLSYHHDLQCVTQLIDIIDSDSVPHST